jgi:hypothetical protein
LLEKDVSPTVLYDKNGTAYKNLGKKRRDWLEKFHKSEHCLQTNVAVLKKASSSGVQATRRMMVRWRVTKKKGSS